MPGGKWRLLLIGGLTAFGFTAMILFWRAGSWADADPIASTLGFVLGLGSFVLAVITLILQVRSGRAASAGDRPQPADVGRPSKAGKRDRRAKIRSVLRLGSPFAGAGAGGCLIDIALGASIIAAASSMLIYLNVDHDEVKDRTPVPASPAVTTGPAPPVTGNMVYAALDVDRVPAGLVVLVDVSASMRGQRFAQVKAGLMRVLARLDPADQVTLIAFGDQARIVRAGAAGNSPREFVDLLPEPEDSATDIGAAIEAGLRILESPGAPRAETVMLLTDGRNDPPATSAYLSESSPGWTDLRRRAAALQQIDLQAFAIPLAGGTDASLLRTVFATATVFEPANLDQLDAQLAQAQQGVRRLKARTVLSGDVIQGVRVTWPADMVMDDVGATDVMVRLTSLTTQVPLRIEDLAISSGSPEVEGRVIPTSIDLAPGASSTVRVNLRERTSQSRGTAVSTTLTLTGTITSPWQEVITGDLGLPFPPALVGRDTPVVLPPSPALWRANFFPAVGVTFGIALLLALLIGIRRSRRPRLTGTLVLRTPDGDEHRVPLAGRAVRLDAVPGAGEVRPMRRRRATAPTITISYSPDGSVGRRETAEARQDETVEIGGVTMTWRSGQSGTRQESRTGII